MLYSVEVGQCLCKATEVLRSHAGDSLRLPQGMWTLVHLFYTAGTSRMTTNVCETIFY